MNVRGSACGVSFRTFEERSPVVGAQELLACHRRIEAHIHRTPVLTSRLIDEIVGATVFFKCENFQRMGAFKMRGAVHAIGRLSDSRKRKGVVTHSSGNFAQALALAAHCIGVKAYVVMPCTAPQVKKDAVLGYGGKIIECEASPQARESEADRIAEATGATFIHPSNDLDVILGQGTAGLELIQDHPDLNFMLAPVGGGGLLAGCALAGHHFGNNCKIIGAEPYRVDDAYRSLASGIIETNESSETIADGLKTMLGDQNFPIIQRHVDHIIRVDEQEIVARHEIDMGAHENRDRAICRRGSCWPRCEIGRSSRAPKSAWYSRAAMWTYENCLFKKAEKRRARDSNSQPVARHFISNEAANHSLTLLIGREKPVFVGFFCR